MPSDSVFDSDQYLIRKQFLKLFGGAFHVYDQQGQLIAYSKMKAFKLKEDIRVYRDESMTDELLTIQARQIIDFSAAYDVVYAPTGEKVGALQRRGFTSLLRDQWVILDDGEREIGTIEEDSLAKALLRRFVEAAAFLMPQRYHADVGGTTTAQFSQRFNPFIFKLDVNFDPTADGLLDRRLGLAAGILLCAIEGRQD